MSVRRACHARAPSSGAVGTLHGPAIDLKPQYQTTTTTGMLPEWQRAVEEMERAEAHVKKLGEEAEQRIAAQFAKLVTLEPSENTIDRAKVDAYTRARGRFGTLLGLYQKGSTGFYPLEKRYIKTFVDHFPMNEEKKRIMQNRWTEIQHIVLGQSRPARNIADNLEYVNLLDEYTKYIDKILEFQTMRS